MATLTFVPDRTHGNQRSANYLQLALEYAGAESVQIESPTRMVATGRKRQLGNFRRIAESQGWGEA
ncbi:hypothetical protein KKB83_02905 [Patescibacteria group bacterium]|nr:hypothetical protein [Patescibacteria group bacterium]